MKKLSIIALFVCMCLTAFSQENLHIYHDGNVIFEQNVNNIDSIELHNYSSVFNFLNESLIFDFSQIDSITFSNETLLDSNIIYIIYHEESVTVINPLSESGVSVTTDGGDVTVNTTANTANIQYHLSGTSSSGSFTISSDKKFDLYLDGVSLTNNDGAAIQVLLDVKVSVFVTANSINYLVDNASNAKKGAFYSKGQLIFDGSGSLYVTGNKKNGIHSDDYVIINDGNITIADAVADGIHCDWFEMNGGTLNITAQGDGIDGDEGYVLINDGNIVINSTANDVKGIKCDSTITVNDGTITMTIAGAQSKGMKCGKEMYFNGGTVNITATGTVVLEESGSGYDPSYCSGIKGDDDIIINGGNFTITCTETNSGGRAISSDSNIVINGGTFNLITQGNGSIYTNSTGTADSYTSTCIKSNGNISILAGSVTCSSSGSGGKGINADGIITLGILDADDANLLLNVTTTGNRFLVSNTTRPPGGGGGQDDNSDYANPKAVKSAGNMFVNSGTITILCTQTTDGGEGLESKAILTINGGNINISTYDDCINAASHLIINGGTTYCVSTGNDAIDSNGPLTVTGGLTIAIGTRAPEEGFDCDSYTFSITGGTIIGIGGGTSTPTASACTQRSIKYTSAVDRNICIKNSANEAILTYHIPTISGLTGPGQSSNVVMLFSSPLLVQGTYTLYNGGTVSGGSDYYGYYTGATYSGGSSRTFTTSSMVTTIQ